MAALTVYDKPICSTCRKLRALRLLQRRVVVRGERAVLARPVERAIELT